MKKVFVLCLLFSAASFISAPGISALDSIFASLGTEVNAYTREGVAFGFDLTSGLELNPQIALGIKLMFSQIDKQFCSVAVIFLRWRKHVYRALNNRG